MIKAIIFDLDGVLIDATDWHYQALNDALGLFGYSISRDDHIKTYNGLPTVEKLKIMSQRQGLPLKLHQMIQTLKRKYTDALVDQKCKPDHAKQLLLNHLHKKYRLAVCSNAQKYSVNNMLNRAHLNIFFELIIGNDEGFKPKPAPDIYLAAFKKMRLKPKEAMIIEDAPHGILAAKRSGAKVIEVKGYHQVNLSFFADLKII